MIFDSNVEEFVDYYYSDMVCSYDDEEDQEDEEYDTLHHLRESFKSRNRATITPKSLDPPDTTKNYSVSHIQSIQQVDCDFSSKCFNT